MWCGLLVGVAILQIFGAHSFIIPDELPSILSVIYSNIPTIKKGTDSRIGWGFRLGDRADFQVLVELGPQTNTQPLANQGDSGNSKRNTLENLANVLYAQRENEKKIKQLQQQLQKEEQAKPNSEGANWLKSWSKDMQGTDENENIKTLIKNLSQARPGLAVGEIDAKSVIPEDDLGERQKPKSVRVNAIEKTTEKVKVVTEGALDDVSLD